jgi:hypothetical protein
MSLLDAERLARSINIAVAEAPSEAATSCRR